jgi:hypothetical protein
VAREISRETEAAGAVDGAGAAAEVVPGRVIVLMFVAPRRRRRVARERETNDGDSREIEAKSRLPAL